MKDILLLLHLWKKALVSGKWLYTAAIYMLGVAAGVSDLQQLTSPSVLTAFIFFLLCSSWIRYGLQRLAHPQEIKQEKVYKLIIFNLCVSIIIGMVVMYMAPPLARLWWSLYVLIIFLSVVPPFEYEKKRFLDIFSSLQWVFPGLFSYSLTSNLIPAGWSMLAGFAWVAGWKVFVQAKNYYKIKTKSSNSTVLFIGQFHSLLLSAFFWLLTALLILLFSWRWLGVVLIFYPFISFYLTKKGQSELSLTANYLDDVNMLLGGLVFFGLLLEEGLI